MKTSEFSMQILSTSTVTCKAVSLLDNEKAVKSNALDVLLKSEVLPQCLFRGIKKPIVLVR